MPRMSRGKKGSPKMKLVGSEITRATASLCPVASARGVVRDAAELPGGALDGPPGFGTDARVRREDPGRGRP